jgi:hypothetical protein
MVQTWQKEQRPNETCTKCGAVYAVTVTRFPCRDQDSFHCKVCGQLMNEWNDTESPSYRLIQSPGKNPNDTAI